MEEIHMGETIGYNEFEKKFVHYIDGTPAYLNENLQKVREHIERMKKNRFERIKAIYLQNWSWEFHFVSITSIDEDKVHAWITYDKEQEIINRSKARLEHLFAYNENNLAILKQIESIKSQIDQLQASKEGVMKKLDKVIV